MTSNTSSTSATTKATVKAAIAQRTGHQSGGINQAGPLGPNVKAAPKRSMATQTTKAPRATHAGPRGVHESQEVPHAPGTAVRWQRMTGGHAHGHVVSLLAKSNPTDEHMYRVHDRNGVQSFKNHSELHPVVGESVDEAKASEFMANQKLGQTARHQSLGKPKPKFAQNGTDYFTHMANKVAVKEEALDEAKTHYDSNGRLTSHTIEAHGLKGFKRTPWRKTFKHAEHLNDWAEKNDAEVHGTRDLEAAKHGNLSPGMHESAPAVSAGAVGDPGQVQNPTSNYAMELQNKKLYKHMLAKQMAKRKEPK